MCQGFNPDNFKLKPDIQIIAGNILYFDPRIKGAFSVSNAGNLVYQNNNQLNNKVGLVDINGNSKEVFFEKSILNTASFSSDNTKIAFDGAENEGKNSNIWMYDIKRKVLSHITSGPDYKRSPVWSPDNKRVAYISNSNKFYDVYVKNSDGSGNDSLLYKSDYNKYTADWSSDGSYIIYNILKGGIGYDIETLQLENQIAKNYLSTDFNEKGFKFSHNMKWILYGSNESGNYQVFVRPFPNNVGRWQISANGINSLLTNAFWSKDDKNIYFVSSDNNLKVVNINNSGGSLNPGLPHTLFNLNDKGINAVYDITNDDKYLLVEFSTNQMISSPLTYIQNWQGLITKDDK
jgi:eukaryotic-like serine/threonine-protein kinase